MVAAQNCDHYLVVRVTVRNGVGEGRVCVCARARGTVWRVVSGLRGVLIGPLIAWNGTNKCVRVSFLCRRRGKGSGSLPFFLGG